MKTFLLNRKSSTTDDRQQLLIGQDKHDIYASTQLRSEDKNGVQFLFIAVEFSPETRCGSGPQMQYRTNEAKWWTREMNVNRRKRAIRINCDVCVCVCASLLSFYSIAHCKWLSKHTLMAIETQKRVNFAINNLQHAQNNIVSTNTFLPYEAISLITYSYPNLDTRMERKKNENY